MIDEEKYKLFATNIEYIRTVAYLEALTVGELDLRAVVLYSFISGYEAALESALKPKLTRAYKYKNMECD
jgi:hypothetical protein